MISATALLTILLVFLYAGVFVVVIHSWLQRSRKLDGFDGPWLARYTDWWKIWVMLFKNREDVYHKMHLKYGDTFQDGPNSLVTCNPDAAKMIYNSRHMPKSSKFNANTLSEGSESVFFALDAGKHFLYRKEVSQAFKLDSVLQMEDRIDDGITDLLYMLMEKSGNQFDFSWYISLFAFDIMFDLTSGNRKGFIKKKDDCNDIVSAFHSWMFNFVAVDPLPVLSKIMFSDAAQQFAPEDKGFVFVNKLVLARVEDYLAAKSRGKEVPHSILKFLMENRKYRVTQKRATDELFNSWIAGFDTMATSISTCVQFILANPTVHSRVVEECSRAPEDIKFTDMAHELRYLDACISETMRLKPANSNTFPRTVGEEGMHVSGRYVPGGTSIAPNVSSLGRSAALYTKPYDFIPERWLEKKNPQLFAFGMGPRECIGRHLAWTVVKKTVFRLFKKFGTSMRLEKPGVEVVRVFRVHEGMLVSIEEGIEKV